MHDDPYADPALYDLEYSGHDEDLAYYTRIASEASGPILELGCGTGRLTLPMVLAGAHVDGVDLADSMLEGLRLKVSRLPADVGARLRFWKADFRTAPEGIRDAYDWVIWPFNAIHHCRGPEEVQQTLEWIRTHLAPGGQVALDAYLPDRDLYDRDPNRTYEHRIMKDPRTGQPLHTWEQGWWNEETRIHHVKYTYKHRDGTEEIAALRLRMFERPELAEIFSNARYRITHSAEDFAGSDLTPKSLKWVVRLTPE